MFKQLNQEVPLHDSGKPEVFGVSSKNEIVDSGFVDSAIPATEEAQAREEIDGIFSPASPETPPLTSEQKKEIIDEIIALGGILDANRDEFDLAA